MSNSRIGKFMMVLLFGAFILLTACSEGDADENASPANTTDNGENQENAGNNENEDNAEDEEEDVEPVTLLMVTHWDDGQFEHNFKNHVEEKYPHITLEHIRSRQDELEENVFAKNLKPDIMMAGPNDYLLEIDLLLDLNPLIEQFNFDVNRLEPGVMKYLGEMSNEGELNGLPLIRPEYALVYNPDIFDAFGVPYPEDHMTWDEVIELGRQVAGERNGQQYEGFHPGNFDFMMRQLGEDALLVDPETHEPIIDQNEAFKIYLERLEAVWSIPGNGMENWETGEDMKDRRAVNLMRDGRLAMAADRAFAGTYAAKAVETGLNFDFVTYPSWGGEYGDYGPNEGGNGLAITTLTEHPEEAFRVVEYLLSDEYQSWQAGQGNLPAVVSDEVRSNFMKDNENYEMLEDKNLEAITNAEAAPIPIRSKYEDEIMEGAGYREGIFNGDDINTIIREMQEQAEGNAKSIQGKE